MKKIKTLIVDDETANRRLIKKLVNELNPDFEILGEAGNILQAYELIESLRPQLVFLDIKMPGGTGFELLERFETIEFEVVFITGFDSYAVKAFEFNALDYLLKPINPIKFSKTLEKIYAKIISKNLNPNQLKEVIQSYDHDNSLISKISIHSGSRVILLNIRDIVMVQSEHGYVSFKTNSKEKHISSKELIDFSFILERYSYMIKANKGTYVNIHYIESYTKGGTCILSLKDGSFIEVSRRKKAEILSMLDK